MWDVLLQENMHIRDVELSANQFRNPRQQLVQIQDAVDGLRDFRDDLQIVLLRRLSLGVNWVCHFPQ